MATMRFERESDERPITINFIPLIDIVLQIICFYLFVIAGMQAYQSAAVELPKMNARPLSAEQPAEVTVNLTADGAIDVAGQAVPSGGLAGYLKDAKAKAAAKDQPLRVAIRADKRQRYDQLDRVLQSCKDAGIPTVSIRAITDGPVAGGAR